MMMSMLFDNYHGKVGHWEQIVMTICSGGRENHLPSSSGKVPISKKNFFAFLTFSPQSCCLALLIQCGCFPWCKQQNSVVGSSTEKLHLNLHNNNIIMKLLKSDVHYINYAEQNLLDSNMHVVF